MSHNTFVDAMILKHKMDGVCTSEDVPRQKSKEDGAAPLQSGSFLLTDGSGIVPFMSSFFSGC